MQRGKEGVGTAQRRGAILADGQRWTKRCGRSGVWEWYGREEQQRPWAAKSGSCLARAWGSSTTGGRHRLRWTGVGRRRNHAWLHRRAMDTLPHDAATGLLLLLRRPLVAWSARAACTPSHGGARIRLSRASARRSSPWVKHLSLPSMLHPPFSRRRSTSHSPPPYATPAIST